MPNFQGQADKDVIFKLPSGILEAAWRDAEGYVNGSCTLEVRTAFVGDGSPIKVILKGRDGSTVETVEGKIYSGLFRKIVKLGPKSSGGLALEAELPEHGLKASGTALRVGGAITLSNPKWKDREGGKDVSLLKRLTEVDIEVKADGAPDGAEARVTILQKLNEHRISELISIPVKVTGGRIALTWIFDYRKDTGALSSKKEKEATAEDYLAPKMYFQAECLGAVIKGPEADFLDWIRFELLGEDALPMAGRKVRLTFADGRVKDAETDDLGGLFVDDAPPGGFTLELVEE